MQTTTTTTKRSNRKAATKKSAAKATPAPEAQKPAPAVEVPKALVNAQKRSDKWAVSKFADVTKPAVVALFALISKATQRKPLAAKSLTDNQRAQASWLFAAGVVNREQTEKGLVYFAK